MNANGLGYTGLWYLDSLGLDKKESQQWVGQPILGVLGMRVCIRFQFYSLVQLHHEWGKYYNIQGQLTILSRSGPKAVTLPHSRETAYSSVLHME